VFHLVAAAGERAALHRTRVVIPGVVELDMSSRTVQSVEDRWKSASQRQQPVSDVVEPHTHAALVGRRGAVAQQTTELTHIPPQY